MGRTLPTTVPYVLYTGNPISLDAGRAWPVALAGRNYMIDTNIDFYTHRWRHQSIPLLRPQQDSSSAPSEASLNPDTLWRRAQDSWHGGAGQTFRDRDGGAPTRFRSSKGLDPWTFWELSLLNSTTKIASSANANLRLAPAGVRLYVTDGQTTKYTTDLGSFSTVTATPAESATGLASNGFDVWVGYGSNGIYATDNGSSSASSYVTGSVGIVAYVKGRLMCAAGPAIYNIVAGGALPAALFTQANTDFSWVGFAEGTAAIYAAGFSGDKSLIYRIAIKPDASSLDQPIIAGELPDGEVIRGIGGYLGFIVLGTDLGVRFCTVDAQGNLNIGSAFGPSTSQAFEGQESFVWFGWSNYDTTSTGLGRMDLRTFTENTVTGARVPAYASDLMADTTGTVTAVATFAGVRVFAVGSDGLYAEDLTALVGTATLETGRVGFGIPDTKILLSVDVRTDPLAGSYTAALAVDGGTFTNIGSETTGGDVSSEFPITSGNGQYFELRLTFQRDAGTITTGPTLTRWTMKATPGGTDSPAEFFFVPILLSNPLKLPNGDIKPVDVAFELETLKGLRRTRPVVTYQEADQSYNVQAEDFEWVPDDFTLDGFGNVKSPNGVMIMQLKRVGS